MSVIFCAMTSLASVSKRSALHYSFTRKKTTSAILLLDLLNGVVVLLACALVAEFAVFQRADHPDAGVVGSLSAPALRPSQVGTDRVPSGAVAFNYTQPLHVR